MYVEPNKGYTERERNQSYNYKYYAFTRGHNKDTWGWKTRWEFRLLGYQRLIYIHKERVEWDLSLSSWFTKYFLNCQFMERENTAELKTSKAWCSCSSSDTIRKLTLTQTKCRSSRWTFAHSQAPSYTPGFWKKPSEDALLQGLANSQPWAHVPAKGATAWTGRNYSPD